MVGQLNRAFCTDLEIESTVKRGTKQWVVDVDKHLFISK